LKHFSPSRNSLFSGYFTSIRLKFQEIFQSNFLFIDNSQIETILSFLFATKITGTLENEAVQSLHNHQNDNSRYPPDWNKKGSNEKSEHQVPENFK